MTKQELQARLEKQLEKKAKIERLMVKYAKLLTSEQVEDAKTLSLMKLDSKYNYKVDFDVYNALDSYRRKFLELEELENTIKNTEEKINKIINFENQDKIEVLVKFLEDWKEKAYNWYIAEANRYIKLKENYKKELEIAQQDMDKFNAKYDTSKYVSAVNKWSDEYYSSITQLTKDIVDYWNNIDTDKLNNILEKEKRLKYEDLVKRITKVVGTIEDVSNLSIANTGDINGIVKGSKASAKVDTISAGGYNIQCFHYRVLVHKL